MDLNPASAPAAGGISSEERTWGLLAHLSALSGMIVPFGNLIAPLLIWRARREHSGFVADHAKEALNFNLSVLIGVAVCYALTWLRVGLLLLALLVVVW